MEQWLKIDDFIAEVNDPNSEHTHTAAHNKFSDWTREEYEKLMGLKNQPMPDTSEHEVFDAPEGYVSNGSKNWTTCVTPVKNQAQCGSCYSFSATEVSESSYCISTGTLYDMSEQVIVDCSSAYGNNGCSGGWYYSAWDYFKTRGQPSEANYPYTGRDGTCKYNAS